MTCAGSLLRLQVDTALRFYAAYIVKDPHAFATKMLKGTRVEKLKDRDGKRLSDRYLAGRLAEEEDLEWLVRVYEETSGYVHLSVKHWFSTFNSVDEATRTVQIKVSAADGDFPQAVYVEAVDAFIAATRLFMRYLHGWGVTKQNPEEVARMCAERETE